MVVTAEKAEKSWAFQQTGRELNISIPKLGALQRGHRVSEVRTLDLKSDYGRTIVITETFAVLDSGIEEKGKPKQSISVQEKTQLPVEYNSLSEGLIRLNDANPPKNSPPKPKYFYLQDGNLAIRKTQSATQIEIVADFLIQVEVGDEEWDSIDVARIRQAKTRAEYYSKHSGIT